MSVYIFKRYHRVIPTDRLVWHLGREVAFEAEGDADAAAFAQAQCKNELGPAGLVIVFDPKGQRVWESAI